jgi:hypothetical protein
VKLSSALLEKTDPRLRDALTSSADSDELRVVAVLETKGTTETDEELDAASFADRRSDRAALIERREASVRRRIGSTLERLSKLGLKPRGGRLSGMVVLDPAASIAKALELPQLRRAALDQELALSSPTRGAAH